MLVAAESPELYPGDIKSVLLDEEQIQTRIAELGAQIGVDYRERAAADDRDLLLITVLKGAVMFVTDLARAIPLQASAILSWCVILGPLQSMIVQIRQGAMRLFRRWRLNKTEAGAIRCKLAFYEL